MINYKLFTGKIYNDERGYFYESFSRHLDEEIREVFFQDNISFSHAGVARGLHYQWKNPMGKLVRAVNGKIIDYIVDIRYGSPDYGKYWKFELSEENGNVLWVPPGYAHGFHAIEDSHVLYKCTAYYNKEYESGIQFLDPDISICSSIGTNYIMMNEKDRLAQTLKEYSTDPKFFYEG